MMMNIPKIDYMKYLKRHPACTSVKSEAAYLKAEGKPTKTPSWIFDEATQELKAWNKDKGAFVVVELQEFPFMGGEV